MKFNVYAGIMCFMPKRGSAGAHAPKAQSVNGSKSLNRTGRNLSNKGKNRAKTGKTGQNTQTDSLSRVKKKRVRRPYTRDTDSQYLTLTEIDALFKVIRSPRDKCIFSLMYHRGLRASEPARLQMTDWNERDGMLYVRRGKNSKERDYSLTTGEVNLLRAWLRIRGRHPGALFASQKGPRPGGLGIHRNQLDRLFRGYCIEAGIRPEKSHLHVLKHSCGTQLADRGEPADVIQDWLGHRAASSTQIYMHFSERRRAEAAARNRSWR